MGKLQPQRVFCATSSSQTYSMVGDFHAPELSTETQVTNALATLRSLLKYSRLDEENWESARWNPLGELISEGDRVLVKPNWVNHLNYSGQGLDCLVTHTSVIEAILKYVLKAKPKSVVIADAPLQGCNFDTLISKCRIQEMLAGLEPGNSSIALRDLRRIVLPGGKLGGAPEGTRRMAQEYLVFDLGTLSYLEPITSENPNFRVTMYSPEALGRTHACGKHQYLIAKEAIEADIVINVPKLKTHSKACITGALKNMVGINGHKEYLPHHRRGGSLEGGDCYFGRSRIKNLAEFLLDRTNSSSNQSLRRFLAVCYRIVMGLGKLRGFNSNIEGAWHGNDTIWRTCLDLQRILHYGKIDGGIGKVPQRKVLTITDAIICGQGNGPLAPVPMPLGMMTMGMNTAAVEWVHALLMGFDPRRIPLISNAFSPSSTHPLACFSPDDVTVEVDGTDVPLDELAKSYSRAFRPPEGWLGHCELQQSEFGIAGR